MAGQKEGVDHEETCSKMVKICLNSYLSSYSSGNDLELYQMDVNTAFPNEELNKETYINRPIGFKVKRQEYRVWELKHSIHSLKQSSG